MADQSTDGASGISDREQRQVEQANASGRTPVVFIHGLWLLPSSWDNWVEFFEENGYAGLTPDWPGDPETVAAESPRSATSWASRPPVECPITAGFLSRAPITSAV